MDVSTWALTLAAAFNLALAVAANVLRLPHHRVMADMMGFRWRNRPPLLNWRKHARRIGLLKRTAGAGLIAFVEILSTVVLAILAVAASLLVTIFALSLASRDLVHVSVGAERVHDMAGVGVALVSHLASARLDDAFPLFGLPTARLDGGPLCIALLLSFSLGAAGLLVKALAELGKGLWYASLCLAFHDAARAALEEKSGPLRFLLGIEKPEPPRSNGATRSSPNSR